MNESQSPDARQQSLERLLGRAAQLDGRGGEGLATSLRQLASGAVLAPSRKALVRQVVQTLTHAQQAQLSGVSVQGADVKLRFVDQEGCERCGPLLNDMQQAFDLSISTDVTGPLHIQQPGVGI